MNEVQFYRGLQRKYDASLHKDCIYFATDSKEIILNGVSYGTVEVDDILTAGGTNPVIGSAIYEAITKSIKSAFETNRIGTNLSIAKIGNSGAYQLTLLDQNGLELSKVQFVGSEKEVDAGGLVVSRVSNNKLFIREGERALVKFTYDVVNNSGDSLGTPGKAKIRIDVPEGAGRDIEYEIDLVADSIATVDITDYLIEGQAVKCYVDVFSTYKGETVTADTMVFTAWLVNLNLTSDFDISTVTNKGLELILPFSISGINAAKTMLCYVDGELYEERGNAFITSPAPGNFRINTSNLNHGAHSVQIVARYDITEDGIVTGLIFSNSIYFSVIIVEEGYTTPIIASRFDFSDGKIIYSGNPYFTVELYDIFNISYYAYSINASTDVEFYSNKELIGTNTVTDVPITINYKYNNAGSKECYLLCNNAVLDFNIIVNPSQYSVEEPTAGLKLYLDALGKSNSSSNRDSWTFEDITSSFEGFTWGGDGWIDSALRLIGGDKVTINYKPFQQKPTSRNAFALSIKFKVDNITDENEELISCLDSNNTGFVIKANEALIRTNSNTLVSTKFAAGEVYNIGFVSFPITYSDNYGMLNANMLYLYVNGVICGSAMKGANDSIYQDNPLPIVIQSKSATLDVYSIRAYDTLLTDDLMFNCYLIDLSNSEEFTSEYLLNDVLDLTGNISVADVYGKIPYVIVTGNYEGLNMVQYAAVMNDKDPKYDVDQILYVDGANPEYSFVVEPSAKAKPQIRLQGTSSLSYPRKNYRLYSKKATLRVGCDSNGIGGTETTDALYAMSENAAPVNCWCLKADYAESSSSHNTGFANMVHEVLTSIGDLTPAQKHKNDNYPYEVRTTIEGHPCLLFARNTLEDAPVFAGKFNFNNDKSTEAVFGFLDINGYHTESDYKDKLAELAEKSLIFPEDFVSIDVEEDDVVKTYTKQDIIDKLEGNPTECWEFLNNGSEFGIFKRTDFGTIETTEPDAEGKTEQYVAWMGCWEARFPDEDVLNAAFEAGVRPYYLERLAKWINSTDTLAATNEVLTPAVIIGNTKYNYDTAEYRAAKFKSEVRDYFDLNFLCDYYIMNDCVAGADQRVKNMMFAFWYDPNYQGTGDGMLCYPIYYDNDTINGINNAGVIAINWDADEETKYESGAYVFAGHDSVLWKNLREQCAKELEEAFLRVRASMTNLTMFKYFDNNQSDLYGERIFNKDTLYKYITPGSIGVDVINPDTGEISNQKYSDQALFVQGTRKAHRHWFITNRMDLFDAKYRSSNYIANEINFKGLVDRVGCSIKAVPARDYYFSIWADVISTPIHNKVLKDQVWTYTHDKTLGVGDIFHLNGIKWMKELDLSNWGGYNSFNIVKPLPVLEKFIVCSKNTASATISDLKISSNMPLLKYLDVSNIVGGGEDGKGKLFSELDVAGCLYLETVIAEACPNLASINFAEGCAITKMVLPENYLNLILKGLPNLTNSGIQFEVNASKVRQLVVDKCPRVNSIELLNSIMNTENSNLKFVRLTDLKIKGNGNDLITIMNKGIQGIDSVGNTVTNYCTLVGEYQLTTLLDNELFETLRNYFKELNIKQPRFTELVFDLNEAMPVITNMDNETSGSDYTPSGYILDILNKRHSYLVKNDPNESGSFYAMQLSDDNSTKYIDGLDAILNSSQGDFCMYEPDYWYKGVNDHKNKTLHVYFSSTPEVPTTYSGIKIKSSECLVKAGYKVSDSPMYNKGKDALLTSPYNSYIYTLPKDHNYKQFRANSMVAAGVLVVDAEDNILLRRSADASRGMFDESYLFDTLPENASKIYFTTNNISSYCLYLTESEEIDAIEPDWVHHKAMFGGKLLSTAYQSRIRSAIYQTSQGYYHSAESNNIKVSELCKLAKYDRGYDTFDYEAYKDVIMLAYAKYGTTAIHSEITGAGCGADGVGSIHGGKYLPNNIDYTVYGMLDTKTNGNYDSYNKKDDTIKYPYISTLMGYHQFIGLGSICSTNDVVNRGTSTYTNTRTKRSVHLYSNGELYNSFILGGRYLDIFGTYKDAANATSNTGFCGVEKFGSHNSGSTQGYLVLGYGNRNETITTTYIEVTNSLEVNTLVTNFNLSRVQRLIIIPEKIKFITNSSEFKQL